MHIKKGHNTPDCLELKKSSIHGLGHFAKRFIPKGTNLGICHYYDYSESPVRHLRNPMVGFFNYSINKNAWLPIKRKIFKNGKGSVTELITTKDIEEGEEVLLKYSWYDPTKPDTEKNKHYIPLPDCVSIEKRNNVYVLYATKDITENFNFGYSHSYYDKTDCYEPNPIGGYLSQTNNPNCKLIKKNKDLYLVSKVIINKGELISVNYEEV